MWASPGADVGESWRHLGRRAAAPGFAALAVVASRSPCDLALQTCRLLTVARTRFADFGTHSTVGTIGQSVPSVPPLRFRVRHYQHLGRYLEPTGGGRLPESSLRWRLQAFQSLDVSLDALAEPNLARELVLNHVLSDVLPTTALAAASQGARNRHVRRCGGHWGRQRTAEAAVAGRDCLGVCSCDQSCARRCEYTEEERLE